MKAFKVIDSSGGYSQTHLVICDNISEVEKIWHTKYTSTIKEITLISDYVIVKGDSNQRGGM